MNTLKDYYNDMLDECTEGCAFCQSYGAARILQEMDPTAYRCGFSDWLQSDTLRGWSCEECGEELTSDDIHRIVQECDEDDHIECRVCYGTHMRCKECDDVVPIEENDDADICRSCQEDMEEDEEDDDDA